MIDRNIYRYVKSDIYIYIHFLYKRSKRYKNYRYKDICFDIYLDRKLGRYIFALLELIPQIYPGPR